MKMPAGAWKMTIVWGNLARNLPRKFSLSNQMHSAQCLPLTLETQMQLKTSSNFMQSHACLTPARYPEEICCDALKLRMQMALQYADGRSAHRPHQPGTQECSAVDGICPGLHRRPRHRSAIWTCRSRSLTSCLPLYFAGAGLAI